jgi:cell pole-organizing protein PopZ
MSNAAPQSAAPPGGEPTMEEILASIRRIISEEETDAAVKPAEAEADAEPMIQAAEPAPFVDLPEADLDDVFELTDIVDEPAPAPAPPPVRPRPSLAPLDDVSFEMDEAPSNGPGLIADDVAERAGAVFDRLERDMAVSHTPVGASLEGLVRELLKPMLKQWLNTYLEEIVERIVREEVERVTSRRR